MANEMRTQDLKDQRPDHLIRDLEQMHSRMLRYQHAAAIKMVKAREAAYEWIRRYVYLMENHHNELVQWVTGGGKKIDDWADELFAPFDRFFEGRKDVVEAIHAGVGKKEFASAHVGTWLAKKKVRKVLEATAPVEPAEPLVSAKLSDAERAERWQGIAQAREVEIKRLKATLAELTRRLGALDADYRQLMRAARAA